MSKIGNYYIELTEQANELGFESVEDALEHGWEIRNGELKPTEDGQEQAHKSWLKEKEKVLEGLDYLLRGYEYTIEDAEKISDAIEFIKKGEI